MLVEFVAASPISTPCYVIIRSVSKIICFSSIGDFPAIITHLVVDDVFAIAVYMTLHIPNTPSGSERFAFFQVQSTNFAARVAAMEDSIFFFSVACDEGCVGDL